MSSKMSKRIIWITLWILSLLLAVFCSIHFCRLYDVGNTGSVVEYDLIYNNKTYSPFIRLSENNGFSATVTHSGTSQKEHFVCTLTQGETSLGQITIDVKGGTITDFYADGSLVLLGTTDEDIVLISDHQVYIDANVYLNLLSDITDGQNP